MAPSEPREHEAKFQVVDPARSAQLAAATHLTDGYQLDPQGTVDHLDTYYDTPAYRLLRTGLALRIRQSEGRATLGLKSLEAGGEQPIKNRLEIELPLPTGALTDLADQRDALPKPLQEIANAVHELTPIAVLHQRRHKRHVLVAANQPQPLAELSIDRVEVYPPGRDEAQTNGATPASYLDEVEVELRDQDGGADLEKLAAILQAEGGLRPVANSKFERALSAIHAQTPDGAPGQTGITPTMHVAEACRLILREQLGAILLLEHGVRTGDDPEFVHQTRVAIRRARAAGRLFGQYFRKRDLRPHLRGLKTLGQALGAARDLDVALENVRHFREQLPKGKRKGVKVLQAELVRQRRTAHTALMKHLDSRDHAEFVERFSRFCRTPGAGVLTEASNPSEVTPYQVRHVLPSMIMERFEHIRAYEVLFERPTPPDIATLHALRIEFKYLRYSLEFVRHLLGKRGETLIAQLKIVQDELGALNDADVERKRLLDWQRRLSGHDIVETRLADLEQTSAALIERIPARFAQFVDQRNRKRLGEAIARL
jgi:CHAD domain-containing protein